MSLDLVGQALRHLPADHRLVRRLHGRWQRGPGGRGLRTRALPTGGKVELRMEYPYERNVWVRPEQQADIDCVMALLAAGDTFVDIGANIGVWTLAAGA